MEEKDPFTALGDDLEEELKRTGFRPEVKPPGPEPRMPGKLSTLSLLELRNLYDEFLSFYEFLTDQISLELGYQYISKAKLEFTGGLVLREIASSASLKNAEARKAAVETDPRYAAAVQDVVFFKAKLAAQQERRDKLKRVMDRIGKELWFKSTTELQLIESKGRGGHSYPVEQTAEAAEFLSGYVEIEDE